MLDALRLKLENQGFEVIDISLSSLVVRSNEKEATLSLQNLYRLLMNSKRSLHNDQLDHFVTQVRSEFEPLKNQGKLFPLLAPDTPDKKYVT